ncbi:MAG: toxin [Candidatus Aminicenantes bacterium]|nr:MAG: toxin [Candidatus Aminicenantes bacterium]
MRFFDWSIKKNEELKSDRNVSFEDVVFSIVHDGLLDIVEHPNKQKYPDQRVFIVKIEEYAYLVPFVEEESVIFLKTIIPSRKMTKKYLGEETSENKKG